MPTLLHDLTQPTKATYHVKPHQNLASSFQAVGNFFLGQVFLEVNFTKMQTLLGWRGTTTHTATKLYQFLIGSYKGFFSTDTC